MIKPRSYHFVCALLATTMMAAPAIAQSAPPPMFTNLDANGVDLTTGQVSFVLKEGSIGSGPGAIEYYRIRPQNGPWTDNWTGGLYTEADGSVTISLGEVSDRFTYAGGVYTSQKADGRTLTRSGGTFTYRASDGTQIIFDDPQADTWTLGCYSDTPGSCHVPLSVTRPDGMKFTYAWDQAILCTDYPPQQTCSHQRTYLRFRSVTSSAGYSATMNYQGNDPGTYTYPLDAWLHKTGVSFGNSVSPPSPAPSSTYSSFPGIDSIDVTDTGGRTWHLEDTEFFTGEGELRLTGIRRPGAASNTTTYTYTTTTPRFISSVTRDGVTTNYNYVVSGTTATMTVTSALNQQTVIVSDLTIGRPTSVSDTLGRTTSYGYDANGRLTRVTQPEGNYVQLTYDARGNVMERREVAKPGSGLADVVTTASYDASCANGITCNQPNSTTDARGNVTDYTYDPTHGGVLSVTAPAPTAGAVRPQVRYSYTPVIAANGDVVQMVSKISACQTQASCANTADETRSTISYNSNLLPISTSVGNGTGTLSATSTMSYDAVGNLLTVDGPLAGTADTVRNRYDGARALIGTVSADPDGAGPLRPRAIRNTYTNGLLTRQETGNVNSQSDADWAGFAAAETVDIGYDANARVTSRKLSAGGIDYALSQTSYDALGRVDCVATRMNRAIYGTLPASACTPGTAGSDGNDRIAKTIYDAAGQVTQSQVAVGTANAASEASFAYSNNGKLRTLKDAANNLTTYEYDGFDRLSKTRYPITIKGAGISSTTDYEQLSYDAASNVTNRRLRDAQNIAFTYDNLNRLTLKDLPGSEPDVTYAYDNLGRLTSASQTGNALSFTYDALSRNLTQVGPQGTVTSAYDLAGRRTKLTYPGSGLYVNYDYLVTGEVQKIRENGAISGIGVLATYGYDDLGRRTSLTFGNGASQVYGYDAVSRLASLTNNLAGTANDLSSTFSYNPAGQIASTTRTGDPYAWTGAVAVNRNYISNGLNQLTASGSIVPTYDSKGNLTSAGTTTYAYSSENRLVSASGGTSATLSYDPGLRLYQLTAGANTTRFAYDGLDMLAEYDGAHLLLRRYVHGPGTDQPLVQYEGAGTTDRRFLSSDERGSIVSVADGTGTVLALNSYDEYGIPGTANAGRFQYTGQAWLPELGIQYSKNRMYSPTLGRFLQTDPIGPAGGINIYGYVGNDPINWIDPLGLDPSVLLNPPCGQGCTVTGDGIIVVTGSSGSSEGGGDFIGLIGFGTGGRYLPNSLNFFEEGGGSTNDGEAHESPRNNLCETGNALNYFADKAGGASFEIAKVGGVVTLAGIATENPVITGAGNALLSTSGALGILAGSTQCLGGVAQGVGGGGFRNALVGCGSLGAGVLVSKGLQASIPRGWRGASLNRAQAQNQFVGNAVGALQGLADALAPKQVSCSK